MPPTLKRLIRTLSSYTKGIFTESEDVEIRRAMNTLEQVRLLQDLTWSKRRNLAHAMHSRTYREGEDIYYQGDPGLGLYIVEKGTVELFVGNDDDRERIRLVHAHEPFGIYSLLGEFPRLETAQAHSDADLLGFFRPDLRTLSKRHPHTGLLVLTSIAQELAARQQELIDHHVSSDRSRAALLRALYEITTESAERDPSPLIN